MRSFGEGMSGDKVINKSAVSDQRNPGQGTGRVDNVGLGRETPTIVKTGAVNNGLGSPSRPRGEQR